MHPNNAVIDPEVLLSAYAEGVFPMGMEDGSIGWFSPEVRGVLPLDERFHIPRGLRRALRKRPFEIAFNQAFVQVMHGCGERPETWITGDLIESYTALHRLGHAHSVEAWDEEGLVGGLYGVSLGGAFFGESMFSRKTDSSKCCLVALVERLRERGFVLLDTQWTTPHLETFGAEGIKRRQYLSRLAAAIRLDCHFG
ncbi:MAG: leucyl/phenylalanyl-tRNA--protein transferase [Verrucomicrobiota bacterium]